MLCALHFRVIADAIGAGKTLISIAIILSGIKAARSNCYFPRKSSATLVVVPPGLIDQWKSEIKKFTNTMPSVLCIYDTEALKRYSLKDIIEADAVICPVDILEAKNYMVTLAKMATGSDKDAKVPKLPNQTGQVEKNGALGVWIPGKSVDLLYPELSNHLLTYSIIFSPLCSKHQVKIRMEVVITRGLSKEERSQLTLRMFIRTILGTICFIITCKMLATRSSYMVFNSFSLANSEQRSLSPMM